MLDFLKRTKIHTLHSQPIRYFKYKVGHCHAALYERVVYLPWLVSDITLQISNSSVQHLQKIFLETQFWFIITF